MTRFMFWREGAYPEYEGRSIGSLAGPASVSEYWQLEAWVPLNDFLNEEVDPSALVLNWATYVQRFETWAPFTLAHGFIHTHCRPRVFFFTHHAFALVMAKDEPVRAFCCSWAHEDLPISTEELAAPPPGLEGRRFLDPRETLDPFTGEVRVSDGGPGIVFPRGNSGQQATGPSVHPFKKERP